MIKDALYDVWKEFNTPDDFAAEPVKGVTNQVGHMAIAYIVTRSIEAIYFQLPDYLQFFGKVLPMWSTAFAVTFAYLLLIEVFTQKWQGRDTISDTTFVAMGAIFTPATNSITPSGRWIRVEETSTGFLVWTFFAIVALIVYAYPRILLQMKHKQTIRKRLQQAQ